MTKYLLDTNIFLRASDPQSPSYSLAMNAVNNIIKQGSECLVTSQVLIEFWVVASRPITVNGLGWNSLKIQTEINAILTLFVLLPDNADIFTNWFNLVTAYNIKGKRTHDIRLLAVMQTYNISHLLTFNPTDFINIPNIKILHPQELITSN
jgi:predicted nucleic acid-binding protein